MGKDTEQAYEVGPRLLELGCDVEREDTVEFTALAGSRLSVDCTEFSLFEGRRFINTSAGVNLSRESVVKLHAWLGEWLERHS